MAEPFVGEIRIFGGNFAPAGWALCGGQLVQVNQNQALFSLIGTLYGGDGRTTFGLPDLRGRFPLHAGSGPGLAPRNIGARAGDETVTVTQAQLPPHDHEPFRASAGIGSTVDPVGNVPASPVSGDLYSGEDLDNPLAFATDAVIAAGGGQQHDNMHPFATLNFIIALTGTFPSPN